MKPKICVGVLFVNWDVISKEIDPKYVKSLDLVKNDGDFYLKIMHKR